MPTGEYKVNSILFFCHHPLIDVVCFCFLFFCFFFRSSSHWLTGNRQNSSCQGCCWRGWGTFLLLLWFRVWWNVCRSWSCTSQESFWWVKMRVWPWVQSTRGCSTLKCSYPASMQLIIIIVHNYVGFLMRIELWFDTILCKRNATNDHQILLPLFRFSCCKRACSLHSFHWWVGCNRWDKNCSRSPAVFQNDPESVAGWIGWVSYFFSFLWFSL